MNPTQTLNARVPTFERRAKRLHADPRLLRDAREWAEEAARDAGFEEGDRYQLKLAMSEAVANAIQHGSKRRSDAILITAFERDGELVFEVYDTGEFVQPPPPSNEDSESGRGLELVELMMDDVRIGSMEGGSVLRFSKRIP